MLSHENNPKIRQHKNCQYITSRTSDGQKSPDNTYKRQNQIFIQEKGKTKLRNMQNPPIDSTGMG
jgi:hypothetical protein